MMKFLELFDLLSYMQEKNYNYFTTLFNCAVFKIINLNTHHCHSHSLHAIVKKKSNSFSQQHQVHCRQNSAVLTGVLRTLSPPPLSKVSHYV